MTSEGASANTNRCDTELVQEALNNKAKDEVATTTTAFAATGKLFLYIPCCS